MNENKKQGTVEQKIGGLEFPRYVKIKQTIASLMERLDMEKVKKDGIDRFASALIQLIDANEDKEPDEKYDTIKDAIYKGNIFSQYIEDENKDKAVDILNATSLLDEEERLLYIVNFYLPDDEQFYEIYKLCQKQPKEIMKKYNLSDDKISLVTTKIFELAKFYEKYKDHQEQMKRTEALASLKDANDNPSRENVDRAYSLISELREGDLRTSLIEQLEEMDLKEEPIINSAALDPQALKDGFAQLNNQEPAIDSQQPIEIAEDTTLPMEEAEPQVDEISVEEPAILETSKEEEPVLNNTESTIVPFPQQEDISLVNANNTDKTVGQDVMAALQNIVAASRKKSEHIEQLESTVTIQDAQLSASRQTITSQEEELSHKDTVIGEQSSRIETLSQESSAKDVQLASSAETIRSQEQELANKDGIIQDQAERMRQLEAALKAKDAMLFEQKKEITSLGNTLNSYKSSLGNIQAFLLSAQQEVTNDRAKAV